MEFVNGLPHVPVENVEIVAAFCQNHGAGGGQIAPVAAHEAVGHVPVNDVFAVFDGHDVAQPAGVDDVVEGFEEGGVAENVADLQKTAVFLRHLHQFHRFRQRVGHRFFQQHIVARFECRQR